MIFSSKKEVFDAAKRRWPDEFHVLSDRSSDEVVFTTPSEYDVYKHIEAEIENEDEWSQLVVWAFHQALSVFIKDRYRLHTRLIRTEDVPFELFNEMLETNLTDDSWCNEREIYDSLP
jgi:hypothetical protein